MDGFESTVVAYTTDDGPVAYYLYDRQAKKPTFLFVNNSKLEKATLAQMEAVETSLRAAPASAPIALAPAVLAPTRGTYSAQALPRDLIERLLGDELPFLAIAIALSGLLALRSLRLVEPAVLLR